MKKSGATSKPMVARPLDLRLPNPPGAFVGRADALAWLAAAIERAPVTFVTGPGGVGKTATVLAAIHSRMPEQAARAIWLDVGPGRPGDQVAQDLLRAIARACDREVELVAGDPSRVVAAALDLAEEHELLVVIDDAIDGSSAETRELFTQLAAYARKSRFVATSRMSPNVPALFGQTLELGAMRSEELGELARAWHPTADPALVARSISLASGSPWILRQLLSGGLSEHIGERELFSGLSEAAIALLEALGVLTTPLPLDEIAAFEPRASATALDELERRGLVNGVAFGVRIHEVARSILRTRDRREIEERAAPKLATSERPEARLEAIRIWIARGDAASAEGVLDRSGALLFSLGYAPLLFSIIREVDDPRILRWRLRCAAELGNPTALASVSEASPSDADERLAWCRTLLAQGELASSEREIRAVLAAGDLARSTRAEAELLLARVLRFRGDYRGALALTAAIDPDLGTALRRRAASALAAVLDRPEEAVDIGLDAAERAAVGDDPDAASDFASALLRLDRHAEASAVLEAIARSPRALSPALLAARETKLALAEVALGRGDVETARALADEVRPYARGRSILRPRLVAIDAARKLLLGDYSGLAGDLARRSELESIDAAAIADLDALAIRRAIDLAEPLDPALVAELAIGSLAHAWACLHRVRATGRAIDLGARKLPSAIAIGHLAASAAELAAGAFGAALASSEEALRVARKLERADLVAIALAAHIDAALASGRSEIATASVPELERYGPRFALEAAWYRATGGEIRFAAIEQLAAAERAPIAARRARAMLGGQAALDHVDLRVLEAVAERAPGTVSLLGDASEWRPCFGADLVAQRVWFPDGREVDLGPTPMLARIVETLALSGGEASKEALIERAWGEREYHPLRHDGKLHAAVRKLRRLLDEDGSEPRFLLTTESGYRLGLPVRVRVPE